MALTEEQLIKIIIGALVFVAVILGVYLAFKNYILDFFKNIGGNTGQQAKVLLGMIR